MENYTTAPLYSGHTNGSLEDGESSSVRLFSAVCYSLVFCISLPSNSFLLWVLLFRERGKRTPPDCLLLQLAISDLCLTVTLPFWASYQLHGWSFGDWACKVTSGLFTLGLDAYMMLLTAMTLDRYVAVVHAASPSAQGRRALWVRRASAATWLVCVAISAWNAHNCETEHDDESGVFYCEDASAPPAQLLYSYLHIVLFCLLPFAVIFFCYSCICATVRRCAIKGQRQAIKLILGITVVFFVCWVPYNVVFFLETLVAQSALDDTAALWYAYYVTHTLAYCHCCLNPLFHVFGAGKFRRHLPLPGGGAASYRGAGETSRQTLSSTTNISKNHHPVCLLPAASSQQTCV